MRIYPTFEVFAVAFLSLALTIILAPAWIAFLKSKSIGEEIRIDGPEKHLAKQGTPTMGGVLILFAALIPFLLRARLTTASLVAVALTISCSFLGFVDDYLKVNRARSLGLKARYKLFVQLIIAIVVGWVVIQYADISTVIYIPVVETGIDLGWLYYVLIFFIVTGTSNGVNLTDGLDGLAAGTVTIVMLVYAGIAFKQGNLDLAIFCAAIGGACVGFIWYNSFPAEIFMGDTGALGLGGAIAAMSILTKTEMLLILIGGIYVIEIFSVIAQVVSFKYFGRRVLRMAPIHHHFELLGWSETKVMVRFWIISGVLAAGGFALFFLDYLTQTLH